ncbi:Mph(E)/Mph(G) family macrolide 2'-phosphotransferase [Sphingobacterium corticibacterium]|uniref:Mph(E)/Mph(G) family macrolide 2'-phosphotransferase n=1 Tax=Sphingobacterium corticibacterium TaxID=2484746 RepID=A0A4Q6XMQ4_9SPHI|nr:Mph(E)/Mph(G) family macrolide 2'-phosphotransferase [Sphingobacterium corticibacterium]RZF61450.1 Mph(E)/Mph(G) family macrolide 2'-phosphotransferase [Sphingobacterium corticibacterium]
MTTKDIQNLTEAHGLKITDDITFNDMGIDFRVGVVSDINGQKWVLRIPRRNDMGDQIKEEKQILNLVKKHLSVEVPDWKIAGHDLVAYPLLTDKPALTYDGITYEVTWNMDKDSPNYISSLAKVLVELHQIPKSEVSAKNLKIKTTTDLKDDIENQLRLVKSEIGVSEELETRYKTWLDNDSLWPKFTRFIHADLYAGHILTNKNNEVSGIIDWTTAHVGDPAMDFSGHLNVFGAKSLKELIAEYEKRGGQIWDKIFEQSVERVAASALAYGFFAVETKSDAHIQGAKAALGVG